MVKTSSKSKKHVGSRTGTMARSEQQQTTVGLTIRGASSHICSDLQPGHPLAQGDVDVSAQWTTGGNGASHKC